MTKRNLRMYQNLVNASNTTLRDIYKSWSNEKERAYNYCKQDCEKNNGFNFRVVNGNTFMFSCGYLYNKNGKKYCKYFTGYNTYEFLAD